MLVAVGVGVRVRRGAAFVIAAEEHHTRTLLGELTCRFKPDSGPAPRTATLQWAMSEDCYRDHGTSSRIAGSEDRWNPSKATLFLAGCRSHHPRRAFGAPPSMRMQEPVI